LYIQDRRGIRSLKIDLNQLKLYQKQKTNPIITLQFLLLGQLTAGVAGVSIVSVVLLLEGKKGVGDME